MKAKSRQLRFRLRVFSLAARSSDCCCWHLMSRVWGLSGNFNIDRVPRQPSPQRMKLRCGDLLVSSTLEELFATASSCIGIVGREAGNASIGSGCLSTSVPV